MVCSTHESGQLSKTKTIESLLFKYLTPYCICAGFWYMYPILNQQFGHRLDYERQKRTFFTSLLRCYCSQYPTFFSRKNY